MRDMLKAKTYGQYFTPHYIAEFMVSLISKPKGSKVLDPCAGTGVFPLALRKMGFNNVDAYEIDNTLPNMYDVKITYMNFLDITPNRVYDVIIGNPPYVRWKNIPLEWRVKFRSSKYWSLVMNGLSDLTYAFIYHSVNMLKKGGELIFITPIFWTETVHGCRLRDYLMRHGYLELIINFNEMKIFDKVSSTIIIFKYVKEPSRRKLVKVVNIHSKEKLTRNHLARVKDLISKLNKAEYISEDIYEAFLHRQFIKGEPWKPIPQHVLIGSSLLKAKHYYERFSTLQDIAIIGNGMVSGLDKAFILTDTNKLSEDEVKRVIYVFKAFTLDRFKPKMLPVPYIYANDIVDEETFRKLCPQFYQKLLPYRDRLLRRYNYGKIIPWWHWVFPRNKHLFEAYNDKIFVPSKERYDTKGYFRFAYVKGLYYATQDVTVICIKPHVREGTKYLLALLNSKPYQEYILYKGFSRGGVYDFSEKPLATIPIPRIDWNDIEDVKIYNDIKFLVSKILNGEKAYEELNEIVCKLLNRKATQYL